MRKRRLSVGWLKRDPRHYRFPLPNTVWEYKLKPIEFVILSYLCCCHCRCSNDTVAPEMIAKGIHKSVGTVKKHLPALVNVGLVTEQCAPTENFFSLPNEIFLLNLPSSAFMVYAYLLLIEDRKTHTCHPSYNSIAAATSLARNTVINSITVLLDKGLVAMEHSHYLDQRGMKWNGNNLYTVLPTQAAVDQFHQRQLDQLELEAECRRPRKRQAKTPHSRLIRQQAVKAPASRCKAACTHPAIQVATDTPSKG